ncbi:hypothetical protein BAE44_0004629 [Dichanthelium oligosanthes]|uniref:Uncharacterized protein n=1 Tax=Dichanthelium oligosanthes TaxID=888268 RepID=A0A1E5WAS9_9POAL|nr:hypothetical protein BAE44_0004629 [Dichanthelium oligosanthes]
MEALSCLCRNQSIKLLLRNKLLYIISSLSYSLFSLPAYLLQSDV